jgi:hypothetical protein
MADAVEGLDDVLAMWSKDSETDPINLGGEVIRISKLHSKYLRIRTIHNVKAKKLTSEYNVLKLNKEHWYLGKLTEEELKALKWEPYLGAS